MSSMYVQTARDLGQLIDEAAKVHYLVGNGIQQERLCPMEYMVWKEAGRMKSVNDWREVMAEKMKENTEKNLDEIERKLLERKLLHSLDFESVEDDALKKIFVIRNAFAYGESGDVWMVGPHDGGGRTKLSEEDYEVWVAASSYRSLLEIMAEIGRRHDYTKTESLKTITEKARFFVRNSLWTIEYIHREEM